MMPADQQHTNARTAGSKATQRPGRRPPEGDHSTLSAARGKQASEPPLTIKFPPAPPAWTPEAAAIMLRILRRAADQHHGKQPAGDGADPHHAGDDLGNTAD
jgi:hypothetical protein